MVEIKAWVDCDEDETVEKWNRLMHSSEKYMIYKQRVRDGQMGVAPQLDDMHGSYGEAASLLYCSTRGRFWWENVCVGVLLTLLVFH